MQALENERNQAVAELDEERERRAQEAMNLRKEVIAVQQSLTDDKERACGPHSPSRMCVCVSVLTCVKCCTWLRCSDAAM